MYAICYVKRSSHRTHIQLEPLKPLAITPECFPTEKISWQALFPVIFTFIGRLLSHQKSIISLICQYVPNKLSVMETAKLFYREPPSNQKSFNYGSQLAQSNLLRHLLVERRTWVLKQWLNLRIKLIKQSAIHSSLRRRANLHIPFESNCISFTIFCNGLPFPLSCVFEQSLRHLIGFDGRILNNLNMVFYTN